MAIQLQGNAGVVADVDGATFRALRTVPKPIDHGSLGHYRLATTVALVATQAANGTLFSFRWGDATRLCVIQKLRLAVLQTAAATATLAERYQAFVARGFTASDSVGTAITLTGNNMKKRTSHATTLVTDIRKSAVAAGLTVGTRTLDAEPIVELGHVHTITNVNSAVSEKQLDTDAGDGVHPIILAQNEGVIVRGPTTVFGAAGTADLMVELAWAEVAAY